MDSDGLAGSGAMNRVKPRPWMGMPESEREVVRECIDEARHPSRMRDLLADVLEGGAARGRVVLIVNDALREGRMRLMHEEDAPAFRLLVEPEWAHGLALILDESRGLLRRLGRCRKPGCGKFNLTFTGRPRLYCNEEHRLAFDKHDAPRRLREWRRRRTLNASTHPRA